MRPLLIRCEDRTVFEIDRQTLQPKTASYYDAYCFSDPRPDADYMPYTVWLSSKNRQWYKEMGEWVSNH